MNRLNKTFAELRKHNKSAFIAYVCAGDPDFQTSLKILKELDTAGADVIELGVPFSDPMADGVANQEAAQRALAHKNNTVSSQDVFKLVKKFRQESETPVVLYTYLNTALACQAGDNGKTIAQQNSKNNQNSLENYFATAIKYGIDGVLILDLPIDEMLTNNEFNFFAKKNQSHRPAIIQLISPTTSKERLAKICKHGEGFLYYISRMGVTGARNHLASDASAKIAEIKTLTDLPVALGFGISNSEQARETAKFADGVVVGSALVGIIKKNLADKSKMLKNLFDLANQISMAIKGS